MAAHSAKGALMPSKSGVGSAAGLLSRGAQVNGIRPLQRAARTILQQDGPNHLGLRHNALTQVAGIRPLTHDELEQAALAAAQEPARPPTTWTILQNDDPNHLGLRCNAFPEHRMALITSGCVPFRRGPRRSGSAGRPRS